MLDRDLEDSRITNYNRTGELPQYDFTGPDVQEVSEEQFIEYIRQRNAEKGDK